MHANPRSLPSLSVSGPSPSASSSSGKRPQPSAAPEEDDRPDSAAVPNNDGDDAKASPSDEASPSDLPPALPFPKPPTEASENDESQSNNPPAQSDDGDQQLESGAEPNVSVQISEPQSPGGTAASEDPSPSRASPYAAISGWTGSAWGLMYIVFASC